MRQPAMALAVAALGCAAPAPLECDPGSHEVHGVCVEDDPPDPGPTTADQLDAFFAEHGGRDAFPGSYVDALEALLFAHDEVAAGDYAAARARVEAIFAAQPHADPVWRSGAGTAGLNVGDPIAYYGLRMLEPIVAAGPLAETGTLTMTAVVATCATVTRPTLPDLAPETVSLDIDPELLADDARALRVSTDLFRRWVTAITGGHTVELVVHQMSGCATVDYTDDGSIIVSYPDAAAMIDAVPSSIARPTDFWWVVAPSGVPGDGSGYGRHFITGGMGAYGSGQPLFLSDDAWFLRKPEHLGQGRYSEIERRAYQPQWFQHEFMHHLFRTWPELELEVTGHQWFDRSTWPSDFEGTYEADYYAEAIARRFMDVAPPLAEGLSAPDLADMDALELGAIAGHYTREPVQNDWHRVTVTVAGDAATWTNAAGVSWSLIVRDGALFSGPDCPYGETEVPVELRGDEVVALWFGGEAYGRDGG